MKKSNLPYYEVRKIKNLRDLVSKCTAAYGDKTAFLIKKNEHLPYEPVSFKKFNEDINSLGTALINLGLQDKRIAIIGENRYEWAMSYLCIVNGVGVCVPLDKELPDEEIIDLLVRSESSAVICSPKFYSKMCELCRGLTNIKFIINMDDNTENSVNELIKRGSELLKSEDNNYLDAEIDENEMKILLYTSGTTGISKAVMLSHNNICSNLMAMCKMIFIRDSDVFLSILPLHHTYECTCGFLCAYYRGATIAYCMGLKHILQNMVEARATVVLGVPLIFESMYKKIWMQAEKNGQKKLLELLVSFSEFLKFFGIDLSKIFFRKIHNSFGGSIRILISGASGINPKISEGFRKLGFLLIQGYGLTECSPIVALNRDCSFKDKSAGLPLENAEVSIVDKDENGVGEIVVSAPSVMKGYYNNLDATKKVLINGYFHTGDLGYFDSDGFLYITGRKKNVIVTKNGKNIFPEEVETYLNRNPFVLESLVSGKLDEQSGEIYVVAQIVPNLEVVIAELGEDYKDEQITNLFAKVVKSVNHKMPSYKKISDFSLRYDEFAKTTTKKIKRYLEEPANV